MQGFNVLGLNLHDGPHSTDRLAQILKGASKSMDSFKEVELAINALNQRIDGIIIGDSGISLQDYLKRQEADNLYLPKGNYLTKHQDLSNYALKSEIPNIPTKISELLQDIKYLTEHQSLAEYAKKSDIPSLDGYLKEHQDLSEYAKKSDVNDVEILYRALNERIASIENSDSGSNYKFKELLDYVDKHGKEFTAIFNDVEALKSELSEVKESLNKLTLGADERFSTLKEISDWIILHETIIDRIKTIEDINDQQLAQIDSNTLINTSQAKDLEDILSEQVTEDDIEHLFF